ncbi:MAG: hypothetical protein KKE17_15695 [Proteobacteria bacterium]|nr:hypothetical protein [Pseudomonadota bacterium]
METEEITSEARRALVEVYGNEPNSRTVNLLIINELGNEDSQLTDQPLPSNRLKALHLKTLDKELATARGVEEMYQERNELEIESTQLAASLPPKEITDKLLRYETTIERQLYRAIDQLDRLQRQRKGETIPSPINIELNSQN